MAELALLASIVQIADTGYRLSLKLYTSGEAISSADRTIITISKDISLTSTVLKELGEILRRDQDEKESICSENLVQTAGNTVKDCLDAFEELDKMILKNMPNLSQGHKATRATMALEKLKWPFIQPRVQLLRGSLDMLRANISLMLNVLIYARTVSNRKKLRAPAPDVYDEARQKTIIEELVNAKDEYVRKFESLKLSIPAIPLTQTVHNIGSRDGPAPTEGNVVPAQHTFNTLPTTTLQNAPPPPFHTFSANTSQNSPASQWPLPNAPAPYPMGPVAVQSDQYNSRPLLHHLESLAVSLVRKVNSQEYQIPEESRSRFVGAIRETYRTVVAEAERREQWRYANYGNVEPSATLPPMIARSRAFRQCIAPSSYTYASRTSPETSNLFIPDPASSPPPSLPPPVSGSSVPKINTLAVMERTQVQFRKRKGEYDEEQYDEEHSATKRAKTAPPEDSHLSSEFSQDEGSPGLESFDFEHFLEEQPKVPEPERYDVVDDLVKLWTLVR